MPLKELLLVAREFQNTANNTINSDGKKTSLLRKGIFSRRLWQTLGGMLTLPNVPSLRHRQRMLLIAVAIGALIEC